MIATFKVAAENRQSRDQRLWQWPIDRTLYDCTPTLTVAEQVALKTLDWELRRGRGHDLERPEWSVITRLVQPLDDARRGMYVQDDRYHRRSTLDAVGIILHGCAVTQQAYWA